MKMIEPKIEFISINQLDIIVTSGGSIETCNGPDAPMNNCTAPDGFMM